MWSCGAQVAYQQLLAFAPPPPPNPPLAHVPEPPGPPAPLSDEAVKASASASISKFMKELPSGSSGRKPRATPVVCLRDELGSEIVMIVDTFGVIHLHTWLI